MKERRVLLDNEGADFKFNSLETDGEYLYLHLNLNGNIGEWELSLVIPIKTEEEVNSLLDAEIAATPKELLKGFSKDI